MARKTKRPKTITIGSRVKVRVVRGPHREHTQRWYWRAERYDPETQARDTLWTGWATSAEAELVVARIAVEAPTPTPREGRVSVRTVRDLLECWVWHVEHVGGRKGQVTANTLRIYTSAARHVCTSIGGVRLDRLSGPTLEGHRDGRLRAGAAASSVRNELDVLGFAWRWWMDRSPAPLKPLPRVVVRGPTVRNRQTPTRADVLAVLEHLSGWARLAVVLLYATGARPGEIRDLTWADVDLDRREIRVSGKTGTRAVPLAPSAVDALRAWLVEHGAAPTARVLPCSPSTFDSYLGPRVLRAACEAACVPRFTPYGLRRAAVDAMARAGVDPATAASVTGHSVSVMLTAYRTVSEDDRRRAVAAAGLGAMASGDVLPFPVGGRAT